MAAIFDCFQSMEIGYPALCQGSVPVILYQWTDLRYLAGFITIFFLLLILLVLRVAPRRSHVRPFPSMARLAELEDHEQAEGGADNRQTPPFVALPSPQPTDSKRAIVPVVRSPYVTSSPAILPAMAELREKQDPISAAELWGRIGRWKRAAKIYEGNEEALKAAAVWMGLRSYEKALPDIEKVFLANPANEDYRLRLIETLLNVDKIDEAEALVDAVASPDSPVHASTAFLEYVGRAFEALDDVDRAIKYYQLAMQHGSASSEIQHRILFIRHLKRLSAPPPESALNAPSPARELLNRALRESSVVSMPEEDELDLVYVSPEIAKMTGHEIIVGHLAFGFRMTEPGHPVGSLYSLPSRYALQRMIAQNGASAVFEARDRLLDFPVALKLYRLPDTFEGIDVLNDRLRATAQLNHPNLAKLTFVDRAGPMLRIATEYLPGGNLTEFLTKLGGAGIPLLIRMAMHVASALHTAHLRGVPHGDVRPENILIGPDQRIKLVDFALAPIPVERLDHELGPADTQDKPRIMEIMAKNPGIQNDLLQFGAVLDLMLAHARKTVDPLSSGGPDPSEELRELAGRLRGGEFTSVLRLWQVLEQIFQRTLPTHSSSDNNRIRT